MSQLVSILAQAASNHDQQIAQLQEAVRQLTELAKERANADFVFAVWVTVPFLLIATGIMIYAVVTFDRRLKALEKGP